MTPSMLAIAFLGGLVSFLSPCVIPLVPGYLSFLTGMSGEELAASENRKAVLFPALLFVLGFSLVFVALGASASLLGGFVRQNTQIISQIGGIIVILFGIYMLGIIKIPGLYSEKRMDLSKSRKFGKYAGFFMGMGFAAGWTPCIGPILASILTLAANSGSASVGTSLLLVYSLGLALPFLLLALMFSSFMPLIRFISRYSGIINKVAGVLLIALGVLLLTGGLQSLIFWIMQYIPALNIALPELV